jgi:pyruvate,water dikinase
MMQVEGIKAPEFVVPGPGVWMLDASHCERPRTEYMNRLFGAQYTEGFRQGFERYGALLDTIEYKPIAAYPYTSVRPLGAPPAAKGHPPKWIFKLLVALHPALRKRCKRASEVIETRAWRTDIERFWRELPAEEARIAALAAEPIAELSDPELLAHLERAHDHASTRMLDHFRGASATMLPVGDFVAHVVAWTGAAPREILQTLRGHSPASTGGVRALEDAATVIADDPAAQAVLAGDLAGTELLAALRSMPGKVGATIAKLVDRYGDVILSGHDVSELRLSEMPELVVATLRARVAAPHTADDACAAADRAAAELRGRVPADDRSRFDELLAEARAAYPLRDARGGVDFWALGVLRRGLLEAGRRLAATHRLERADDVFDCSHEELRALLEGSGPASEIVARRARWRRTGRVAEAPPFVGGVPAAPPPPEWLPAGAARVARAFGVYLDLMGLGSAPTAKQAVVTGLGASPGKRVGRARLVGSAADFSALRQGDILVATITTPAYNVILPLLGGVVTDRGGLLSHPAIVSREYGFPAVVGAGDATSRIPDGAVIELDGDAGTVRIVG